MTSVFSFGLCQIIVMIPNYRRRYRDISTHPLVLVTDDEGFLAILLSAVSMCSVEDLTPDLSALVSFSVFLMLQIYNNPN